MKYQIAKPLMLAVAAIMPAAGLMVPTPATAQASQPTSAQAMAVGLLAAINGQMSDRNSWARENLLRDNLYGDRLDQLRTIARRTDGLELVNVSEAEDGMYVDVRDAGGRNSRIVVQIDSDFPGKVRGLTLRRL